MSNSSFTEVKVGLFIFIGLAILAAMAIHFGRVGQGQANLYSLYIEFPDAGGLLKNSDVLLSGAPVGRVAEKPSVVPERIGKVKVEVLIREDLKLPRGSSFQISSTGMMGDRFVEITPPDGFDPAAFDPNAPNAIYQPGETVTGSRSGGLNELTRKGEIVMNKLSANLDSLKGTLDRLHSEVLSEANVKNLNATFANIKTTGEHLATASKGIDDVVAGAKSAVSTVQETMAEAKSTVAAAKVTVETAGKAAEDIRVTIDEARKGITDARGTVQEATRFLKALQTGPGTIAMLMNNHEVARNLNALIANIRRHGVLFYRDSARKIEAQQQRQTQPTLPARRPGR